MSISFLIQIFIDLILLAGIMCLWWVTSRPAKEDPRLSRGLQLLQTKISILEDLSDRADRQVQQLSQQLENRARAIRNEILESEKAVQHIQSTTQRGLEVVRIFRDKIPHEEIVEREKTLKYVQVARLAHQGFTPGEISSHINLPLGEIEIIARLNAKELQFSEDSLEALGKNLGA